MCGVAAIFSFHPAAPAVDREELVRIRDHMSSRGPDAKGEWFSLDGRLAIGHRRLAIIDLSERGVQPMTSADGNLVISFNGEIYNYKALRARLEKEGRSFRSRTDTEVILHLYASKGEAMLDDLRGMFAFVLWDQRRRVLMLGRDPYGIKPLYYANDGWSVRIASQVKALLAGGKVSRQVDPAGQVGFFLFGSVPEPYTSYQEIRAVPAGCIVRISELGPSMPTTRQKISQVYVNAKTGDIPTSYEETQELTSSALRDSVAHHLIADVPVGVFLSAGIDSGSIVGLIRDVCSADIRTVTLAFPEFSGQHQDESPLAERTAKLYQTRHTTRYVSEEEFRTDLPKILDAMDQPSIDGINTWLISKVAAELGLKACLSGLGGDELFGGYPSFRRVPRWVSLARVPSHIPFLGAMSRALFRWTRIEELGVSPKAAGFLSYAGSYSGAFLLQRGIFMPWELPQLLGRDAAMEGLRRLRPLDHIDDVICPDPGTAYARVACLESSLYLRNQLLRDADWGGMAHSLEIRVPLVDVTLLKRLAPIAHSPFTGEGKSLLASAPNRPGNVEVMARRKTGFCIPTDLWLSNLRENLDSWRKVPTLAKDGCHWSRRLVYAIHDQTTA
jgi:asparagine synthase (glutamine-hydrolysing)